ncbi:MAG: ferredoxin [Cyanobacteria bacterium SW_9_47_5]|nr:MAG: ferredoxin [Cyanobacteria bacterium SW_9_47_5]
MLDDRFLIEHESTFCEPYRLLYVGSLLDHKGVGILMPVLEKLQSETEIEFKLTIVGDGELRSELKDQAQALDILENVENQGVRLPFSCRHGACTTCAVRVLSGEIYHPEAMGLSPKLHEKGYSLLCVGYPRSDLEVETQDEDEVYELQFGRYFGKGKVRPGIPLDED